MMLDEDLIKTIRDKFNKGLASPASLAAEYNIEIEKVKQLIFGDSWTDLEDDTCE